MLQYSARYPIARTDRQQLQYASQKLLCGRCRCMTDGGGRSTLKATADINDADAGFWLWTEGHAQVLSSCVRRRGESPSLRIGDFVVMCRKSDTCAQCCRMRQHWAAWFPLLPTISARQTTQQEARIFAPRHRKLPALPGGSHSSTPLLLMSVALPARGGMKAGTATLVNCV